MRNLLKLYKKHICSEPSGAEIHYFFSSFNLGVEIKNPNPELENNRKIQVAKRKNEAENWIYKNSKLKLKQLNIQ